MFFKMISLDPTSVHASLRNLARNQKPAIIEPLLARTILEYWENGTFPALPAKAAKRPRTVRAVRRKAAANV
jgi:hypothetical protein